METKSLPDYRMLDVINLVHTLKTRVLEEIVIRKGPIDGDVDVPIDCCGQDETTESLVVGWQIGATSTKGYTQRRSRNDHDAACSDRRAIVSNCHPEGEGSTRSSRSDYRR